MFLMTNNRASDEFLKLNNSDIFLITSNYLIEAVLNIVSFISNVIFVVNSLIFFSIINFSSSIIL